MPYSREQSSTDVLPAATQGAPWIPHLRPIRKAMVIAAKEDLRVRPVAGASVLEMGRLPGCGAPPLDSRLRGNDGYAGVCLREE